ncbi:MAG: hypothetical protein DMF09_04970 [Verrucomicrobia bacterium]|nr:MAG: hypothetical protein DMF09_04970 [Verrucomicrobiota bacterium]
MNKYLDGIVSATPCRSRRCGDKRLRIYLKPKICLSEALQKSLRVKRIETPEVPKLLVEAFA